MLFKMLKMSQVIALPSFPHAHDFLLALYGDGVEWQPGDFLSNPLMHF